MKKVAVLTTALSLLLANAAQAQTSIEYWLWDSNQQPAYQKCSADFTKKNPGITVKVTQKGWDDYWTGITTGFVSGTAPDVFTNHLARYPEFADNNQLVDIAPLIAQDKVATNIYYPGLADLWVKSGKRYGLPKDWDTVAVIYNVDMLKAAGITPAQLNNLSWNPTNGGTFEQAIARLTLDKNGKNGLAADFDKANVKQFGFASAYGAGANGQTEWSWLTATTGWKHNEGVFGKNYNFGDPRFVQSIQWLADLNLKKGYIPAFKDIQANGPDAQFVAKKAAMVVNGSWMIKYFVDNSPFKVGFALLPKGPNGKRMSMFNGLADSIWVGSKNKDAAWKWVKYLASAECQNTVGSYGVVFPAINSGVVKAQAVLKAKGVDVTAFTRQAKTPGGTFLFPITDNASKINDIMTSTMEGVFLGKAQAKDVLPAANDKVNALFK
ncbi:ABC transporter substrate-binding protein [Deinococcus koreensis]|uniref:Sugar ABC transporter substrate-binding protein n=1 Tax=Deinococcus koreensis TaxID=2054903 RepID=A0A2K3V035_9DEIO|nr:sugar ABC transporter substrate-binding protein [Deinococcus koreensis]PNY82149.1 sugar ABC transporter substrate-binding protein [Deinococcus koreensis]